MHQSFEMSSFKLQPMWLHMRMQSLNHTTFPICYCYMCSGYIWAKNIVNNSIVQPNMQLVLHCAATALLKHCAAAYAACLVSCSHTYCPLLFSFLQICRFKLTVRLDMGFKLARYMYHWYCSMLLLLLLCIKYYVARTSVVIYQYCICLSNNTTIFIIVFIVFYDLLNI